MTATVHFRDGYAGWYKMWMEHNRYHDPVVALRFAYPTHVVLFARSYKTDSSFAYHHMDEVFRHYRFKKGGPLLPGEELSLKTRATSADGHLWIHDSARVGVYRFWRRSSDDRSLLQ
jgi:hypothetical protein